MTDYTDPPGMPDDERMTPAEFKVTREFLGLTGRALAEYLSSPLALHSGRVTDRTVRNWEEGKHPIPDWARQSIEDLEERTAQFVGGIVGKLLDLPDPAIVTYRTDAEYWAAHPEMKPLSAGWHRAVCARVAQEVPGLSITYVTNPGDAPPVRNQAGKRTRA